MGDEYSHAHAACLAAQLPKGSRCRAHDDPHDGWTDSEWVFWRIERNLSLLRWNFIKYDGEKQPMPMPYPGQAGDAEAARLRFETGKEMVDRAFDMNGGGDE